MKRKWKISSLFGKRTRAGGYSAFAAAVVIALCVCVNALAGSLPSTYTQLDLTDQSLFSLSEQTKRIVKSVDTDVKLMLLASSGNEDPSVLRLLDRYADLSSHISVETVDPSEQPTFLDRYELAVGEVYENSVVVDASGRHRLVSYTDIYVTDYEMDYYSYNYSTSHSFAGENALTNAIHYVTNEDLPVVYTLTGHGEGELDESMAEMLAQDNIMCEPISILSAEEITEDASVILINTPSSDISGDEAEKLIAWLDAGGSVVLTTAYIDEGEMENLLKVTSHMGVSAQTGLIVEGDASRHLTRYPYYLLPEIESHEITEALIDGGYYILMAMSQPLYETDDSDASVTFLMNTSDSAYLKAEGMNTETTEKEEGDETGSFSVGAASEKGDGKLVWFASEALLDPGLDRMVSGANSNVFLNAVNWMCGQTESISIRAKSLDAQGLMLTSAESNFLSIAFIGIIPAAVVGVGACVCIRRKKR